MSAVSNAGPALTPFAEGGCFNVIVDHKQAGHIRLVHDEKDASSFFLEWTNERGEVAKAPFWYGTDKKWCFRNSGHHVHPRLDELIQDLFAHMKNGAALFPQK